MIVEDLLQQKAEAEQVCSNYIDSAIEYIRAKLTALCIKHDLQYRSGMGVFTIHMKNVKIDYSFEGDPEELDTIELEIGDSILTQHHMSIKRGEPDYYYTMTPVQWLDNWSYAFVEYDKILNCLTELRGIAEEVWKLEDYDRKFVYFMENIGDINC